MKKLSIAEGVSLPLEAATESFAIVGRRGAGKTNTGVVMAEEMLDADAQAFAGAFLMHGRTDGR